MENDTTETKAVFKSKTVLINMAIAIAGLYPPIGEFVSENPEAVLATFATVNILIRLITKGKVQLFKAS